jgi:RNA polymerase sigma factor (sigma-70 family)
VSSSVRALPPFEHVVTEHGAVVLRVCRALLNPTDAQDAWSETFLAAMAAYPGLRPDSNVRGWLVTIAHRKAIDVHRQAARTALPMGELPERPAPAHPDGDPALWAAVAALPERQRLAVVHHHLGGLPYAEIAALTGSTPAATRRAASDGIATLRRLHSIGALS